MYISSSPYTKLLEIDHPSDGLTVGAKYLLDAFVSITPFIPNYPKLSGLEEATTISLFLTNLSIRNWNSKQQDPGSLWYLLRLNHARSLLHSPNLGSQLEWLEQLRLGRHAYNRVTSQVLNVKAKESLDKKLLHQCISFLGARTLSFSPLTRPPPCSHTTVPRQTRKEP